MASRPGLLFTASPLSGSVPLTVTFTNVTTGEVTDYLWVFGNGMTDTITHPVHVYTTTGVYTVSLTASGPGGTDTLTRTNYVTATAPEVVETRVITYTYDPLYRLTAAEYSTGESFVYDYDAVGNVTLASEHITTTRTTIYTYNAASQLVTSTVSGESTVWWYTYDANGNLTHQTPNGTAPADGQVRYTWDALNRLVKVERYVGGSYEPLAEAAYDGSLLLRAQRVGDDGRVGRRTRLTMWVAGQPVTTTYTADPLRPGRVLIAADGTATRRYLYGPGPIGESDGQWSYYLRDGQGSLRQVADAGGTLTLVRSYKPFGAILEETGSGASAYGYFGAWWDSGLGLLYWDGRYYDPVTGRFLSPQWGRRNPYSPYGMPLTMGLLAPLVVWSAAVGKRRLRWWHWLLLLVLVGVGVVAVGCGETPPSTPTMPPTLPPGTATPEPTPTPIPTLTPTSPPPPTYTPAPIPETCTPLIPEPLTPEPILTPIDYVKQHTTKLNDVEHTKLHLHVTVADFDHVPDRAILAMMAIAEAGEPDGTVDSRENAMWIVRTRVEFDLTGAGRTYRAQILYPNAFSSFSPITLGVEWGTVNFNDSFDPKGAPDGGRFARLYEETWQLAGIVMNTPYEQMPEELRRYDSFVAKKAPYITNRPKGYQGDEYKEVAGDPLHFFGNAYPKDDVWWDTYESGQS